jgi:hypothetical protein
LYGSTNSALGIVYASAQTGSLIANNIIWQANNKLTSIDNPTGLTFQNNLWKVLPAAAYRSPGDKIGDPSFAATPGYTAESYRPAFSSPTCGGGLDIGVAHDFFVQSRGPLYDIGAVQYVGSAAASPTAVQPTNTVPAFTPTAIPPTATATSLLPTNTAVAATPTTSTPSPDGNLVLNPGFETAGSSAADAANWIEGTNHVRASDKFHTGGWALRSMYRGAGTDTRTAAPIAVSPNTTYTYSGYLWRTNSTGGACLDMNDIVAERQLCTSTAGSWQYLTGTWSSGANTSVSLRLITDGSPTGDIWFDDLSLTISGGPAATPTSLPPTVTSLPPTNTLTSLPPTATFTSVPTQPLPTLTLQATQQSSQLPQETTYDSKQSAFVYSAGWVEEVATAAIGGSYARTATNGAFATFTFTGQSFSLIYKGGPSYRTMDVYIDGVLAATIDERHAVSTYKARWDYPGQLPLGQHTLKFVFVTTSSSTNGSMDAVIVR